MLIKQCTRHLRTQRPQVLLRSFANCTAGARHACLSNADNTNSSSQSTRLCHSSGARVLNSVLQRRESPHPTARPSWRGRPSSHPGSPAGHRRPRSCPRRYTCRFHWRGTRSSVTDPGSALSTIRSRERSAFCIATPAAETWPFPRAARRSSSCSESWTDWACRRQQQFRWAAKACMRWPTAP